MENNQMTINASDLEGLETRHFSGDQVPPTGLVLSAELVAELKHSTGQD